MGPSSFGNSQSLKGLLSQFISMVNSSRAPGETNSMVLFSGHWEETSMAPGKNMAHLAFAKIHKTVATPFRSSLLH